MSFFDTGGYIGRSVVYPGTNIVTDGLVLYLDAGDRDSYPGTGTTWFDLSGNSRNATINGSPTFTDNYFTLTSDSTYFNLASNSGLVPGTNSFTYSAWIYLNSIATTYDTIFENGSWTDTLLFRIQPTTDDINTYAEGATVRSTTWNSAVSTWYNVILMRSGTTGYVYINGVSIDSFSFSTNISLSNTSFYIGRSVHAAEQYLDGRFSVFSIYNRALTADEITQNFNVHRGRFGI